MEGAGGARRGGGGGGGKMADFLPSRSVLSVCFPGCVLTSGEAEQQRKSKEIDKCLSREKTYVKRLVKILLLGAGESGKSTFLKQMRIIHGQDFDQRAREEFRPTIYSNVIKGAGPGSEPGGRGPGAAAGRRGTGHRPRSLSPRSRNGPGGRARGKGARPGHRPCLPGVPLPPAEGMPGGAPFPSCCGAGIPAGPPPPTPSLASPPARREVKRAGCRECGLPSPVFPPRDEAADPRASPRPYTLTPRPSAACPASPSRVGGCPSHMGSGLLPLPCFLGPSSVLEPSQ